MIYPSLWCSDEENNIQVTTPSGSKAMEVAVARQWRLLWPHQVRSKAPPMKVCACIYNPIQWVTSLIRWNTHKGCWVGKPWVLCSFWPQDFHLHGVWGCHHSWEYTWTLEAPTQERSQQEEQIYHQGHHIWLCSEVWYASKSHRGCFTCFWWSSSQRNQDWRGVSVHFSFLWLCIKKSKNYCKSLVW